MTFAEDLNQIPGLLGADFAICFAGAAPFFDFLLTFLQNLLTKTMLRDMMYYAIGGIIWIFS